MYKKPQLDVFEKVVLRKSRQLTEVVLENLEEMSTRSSENILKVLEERSAVNESFTQAGSALVHIENSLTRVHLLIRHIENAYHDMVTTKTNQVIALLGSSLKAKEFTKSISISHFSSITSDSEKFSSCLQSAVDLLTIFGSDGENTYYGENIHLMFNEKFRLSGCKINAKITDLDFPKTCGIFRILFSQSDPVMQHLGLVVHKIAEKNIEILAIGEMTNTGCK